jgi:hypothetical protein
VVHAVVVSHASSTNQQFRNLNVGRGLADSVIFSKAHKTQRARVVQTKDEIFPDIGFFSP